MATIENLASVGAFRAMLDSMDESELLAQQISQKGAIHVIEFLLQAGPTPDLLQEVLASLRSNMATVEQVAQARGYARLFGDNSTGFH